MPRVVDVEEKRTEIAYAAWYVIAHHGLAGTSLRAVAAEAGISLGAIQHYFDSKESLLLYACEQLAALAGAQWEQTSAGGTPRERLTAVARTSLTANPHQRLGIAVWSAFVVRAAADPATAAVVHRVWVGAVAQTAELIADVAAAEGLRLRVEPEALAEIFGAFIDGVSNRVLAGHLSFEQASELADRFLAGFLGE